MLNDQTISTLEQLQLTLKVGNYSVSPVMGCGNGPTNCQNQW